MPAQPIDRAVAWSAAATDPAWFAHEQETLSRVWNFLGFAGELARDGDWIVRDLWGRSIFVQRFGDDLKGFENRCAHRFFPLRHGARGNGRIRCGFHGWIYDRDGAAVGIPACKEVYGCTPRQIGARLRPVEIALCGKLIFGRFADADTTGTLDDYLGELAPILSAFGAAADAPRRIDRAVRANWKLAYHITLEDYHIVAVHGGTFGKNGHLKNKDFRYYRRDPHSVMLNGQNCAEETLAAVSQACAAGRYEASGYKIFHIFPNLVVLHYWFFRRWYVLVMHYPATAVDRTAVRTWFFTPNFANKRSTPRRIVDWLFTVPRDIAMRIAIRKIVGEDNRVCEALQRVAHQAGELRLLSAQEERIAWFDEACARALGPVPQAAAEDPVQPARQTG